MTIELERSSLLSTYAAKDNGRSEGTSFNGLFIVCLLCFMESISFNSIDSSMSQSLESKK